MRITTRLKFTSTATAAALIVLAPVLIWSFVEFKKAKNDYILADAIKINFFERASFRDQYFLYREDRMREQWYESDKIADRLLKQAAQQFHNKNDRQTLERLRTNIEESEAIFRRIVANTQALQTSIEQRRIYEELDKRLFSQLLLRSAAIREMATELQNAGAQRVEQTYRHLTVIIGLFALILALATIVTSIHLGRLIRKRLAPLHDGAKIVADGDLNYRIHSKSTDEFSELAESINTMTEHLQSFTRRLEDSEQQYHMLFDNNPMPMWVFEEASLRFLMVNDRAIEHYGYTRAEFSHMTLRDIRPEEDVPELVSTIASSPDGKISGEWRHKKKDGTIIDVAISTAPMLYGNIAARIALIQDITGRKQFEHALRRESEKNLALLRNASDGIHILDTEGNIIEASDSFCSMLGYSRDEIIGMNVARWDAQFSDLERSLAIKQQFSAQRRSVFETRHRRKDGSVFDVEVSGYPLELDGKPVLFNSSRDITERKKAEDKLLKSETSLRAILDNVPYLIWQKDLDGRFIAVNKAFFNSTGRASLDAVLGKTDLDLWPEAMAKKYRADDAEVLATRKQQLTEEMSMDNGEVHWVETFKAPIMDAAGNLLGTTGFAQDITVRKNAEGKIRHLAHYDPLTDLPNRTLFSDRLQQALSAAKRDKVRMALMFLDLDKFKPINDELGHHVGDLLLKEVAKRMQDCVRESDTVARIGGDEFVILLPVINAEQDAMLVAEKIRMALNQPFVLVGQSLNISSSTGIAVYPEHGNNETQLFKNADTAMYHAKENGRNDVQLYRPEMQ